MNPESGTGDEDDEDFGNGDDDSTSSDEDENETATAAATIAAAVSGKEEPTIQLPLIVRQEIERRKNGDGTNLGPPNPLVVHALRQYFETGKGDPMVAGGFMALMREIGAVAQSKDHLVKNSEHNIYYLGAKGQEETSEFWQDQLERHEAEVRLLRYGEFIEMQEMKGISFDTNWRFQLLDDKDNLVGDDALKEESIPEDTKPSSIDDNHITEEQLEGLSKNFMGSFWKYVNHEQIQQEQDQSELEDMSQSQSSMSMGQSQSSLLAIKVNGESERWTEDVIRQKCKDLHDVYRDQKRPMGYSLVAAEQPEPSPAAKKMSGKKQRKRQKQQQRAKTNNGFKKKDHAEYIREHLQSLLKLMDQQLWS